MQASNISCEQFKKTMSQHVLIPDEELRRCRRRRYSNQSSSIIVCKISHSKEHDYFITIAENRWFSNVEEPVPYAYFIDRSAKSPLAGLMARLFTRADRWAWADAA